MTDLLFDSELVEEFHQADSDYLYAQSSNTADIDTEVESNASSSAENMDVEDSETRLCSDDNGIEGAHASVREADEAEDARIDDFFSKTCGCKFGLNGAACSSLFTRELVVSTRMNCLEMTKAELDLVILANLEANRRPAQESSRTHVNYWFCGYKVCKSTFLFVHAVGPKHYKNLISHFSESGLTPRRHGNTKRLPANTVPFSVTQSIVQFIINFATVHALPLPGRIPGVYSEEKVLLLPSDMTKRHVYNEYCKCTETPVSRRKFENLWSQLVPHISAMNAIAAELTCPQPHIPSVAENISNTKKQKSQRKCSHCRQSGHTKTVRGVITCPQLL